MNHRLKKIEKQSICFKKVDKTKGVGYAPRYIRCTNVQNPKRLLIPYFRHIATIINNYED